MTFFCIADPASAPGFRLAGIQTREVATRAEAVQALAAARADKNTGIILVTSATSGLLGEELEEKISENPLPLILEVPSMGDTRISRSASELLKSLAGM